MSANIPFEIQEEILKRVLSTKSLIQFRSVSKQWKSLIDSSQFITHHNQAQPHHLLIKYTSRSVSYEEKYVLVVDDDCFPHHKFSPIDSPIVKSARVEPMLDCSHGLVCLLGYYQDQRKSQMVIWNPSIRKSVGIPVPSAYAYEVFGFGVCPKTSDPKIVRITRRETSSMDRYAEVFTLSTRVWRRVLMNFQFKSLHFPFSHNVVSLGVIYWVAHEYGQLSINTRGLIRTRIISFDLTSEEFGEVDLPECLAGPSHLRISKLKESLVVLNYRTRYPGEQRVCDAWMMLENGVSKSSFSKLFTFLDNSTNASEVYRIIGFRTNGQPIIKLEHFSGCKLKELEAYDPCSKHLNGIGISGYSFWMTSYTESLLLLNHSDSVIKS